MGSLNRSHVVSRWVLGIELELSARVWYLKEGDSVQAKIWSPLSRKKMVLGILY